MNSADVAGLLLRVVVGVIMIAHGYNHLLGGGKIAGTARWFGGLGLRPPLAHAWMSVLVELAAGIGLIVGLLTSVAAMATVAVMSVAGIAAHRKNGFYVFKDGYEYVLLIAVVCVAIAITGPGRASLDHAIGIDHDLDGSVGAAISLAGILAALGMLAVCWRPSRPVTTAD
ncbi:DoxX family protein [Jatrophihabitans sp. DSM 45814]